ncbi:MAG: N-acetylmuramoyl-L-alanine amidase family protein [bacterium]
MDFRLIRVVIILILLLILPVIPSFISTQETIGSTYIEIKDIAEFFSTKLEYKYSRNEIIINNSNNEISINEDGYLGLKNKSEVIYLPSKIYHKNSVIYSPIELTHYLEDSSQEEVLSWNLDYEIELTKPKLNLYKYVIIDPGHGGKDPGATDKKNKVYEKDIVLDIAINLKKELLRRKPDLTVILTRTKDKELINNKSKDLRMRAEIGSQSVLNGNGIFISIHANAMPNKESNSHVKGIETWYYYPSNDENVSYNVSDYRKQWINKVYGNSFISLNKNEKDKIFSNINKNIGFYSKSLAKTIQSKLYSKLKSYTKNRGIKRGIFQVLRESVIPAILCEVGFITNTDEMKLLISPAYQKKIVEGLADGIIYFIEFEKPVLSE